MLNLTCYSPRAATATCIQTLTTLVRIRSRTAKIPGAVRWVLHWHHWKPRGGVVGFTEFSFFFPLLFSLFLLEVCSCCWRFSTLASWSPKTRSHGLWWDIHWAPHSHSDIFSPFLYKPANQKNPLSSFTVVASRLPGLSPQAHLPVCCGSCRPRPGLPRCLLMVWACWQSEKTSMAGQIPQVVCGARESPAHTSTHRGKIKLKKTLKIHFWG